jgi:hypothetical protein
VPALAPHDVLVYVMAAGVNYNNVWAAMGIPIDVIKTRQKKGEPEDFHIGGSDASGVVWAVGSGGRQRQGRRRGGRPLRHVGARRSVGRRRQGSDAGAVADHLGLRVELGQLRAVHQGAGSPVPAQAAAAHLGGGRGVHAGRRDRLPHAARLAAQRGRPRRPGVDLGRRRRPRLDGDPDRQGRRRARGRGGVGRRQDRVLQAARRGRRHRSPQVQATGASCRGGATSSSTGCGSRARAISARRSGTRSARRRTRRSSSSTPARPRCRPRAS